jgi:hypothetical protein
LIDGHTTFALGGKSWSVPPLPWRVVKRIEPSMLALYKEAKRAEVDLELKTDFLDMLATVVFHVLECADSHDGDPPPTREAFEDLPFHSRDLLALLPRVGAACGLQKAKPNGAGAGESDEGKPIGTT